jgi:hypothetical protein
MNNFDLKKYLVENKLTKSSQLEESPNTKFKDIQIGQKFLRFGENGQMWEKVNNKQAKFIKNVGKKTAPFDKPAGTHNIFPQTMDITLPISSTNESEFKNLINEDKDGFIITNDKEWYAGAKDYIKFAKYKSQSNLYPTKEKAEKALSEIPDNIIKEKNLKIKKF